MKILLALFVIFLGLPQSHPGGVSVGGGKLGKPGATASKPVNPKHPIAHLRQS